jgi:hypothetical protein
MKIASILFYSLILAAHVSAEGVETRIVLAESYRNSDNSVAIAKELDELVRKHGIEKMMRKTASVGGKEIAVSDIVEYAVVRFDKEANGDMLIIDRGDQAKVSREHPFINKK